MKLREGTGSLNCRICDASFQMPIHHLHEPIDVFSEWLDACEAAEKGNTHTVTAAAGGGGMNSSHEEHRSAGASSAIMSDGGEKTKAAYASLGLDDSDDDSD